MTVNNVILACTLAAVVDYYAVEGGRLDEQKFVHWEESRNPAKPLPEPRRDRGVILAGIGLTTVFYRPTTGTGSVNDCKVVPAMFAANTIMIWIREPGGRMALY
jgi:hypothetical protein